MNRFSPLPLIALLSAAMLPTGELRAQEGVEFFEKKIRPVLIEHCYACHSAEAKKANKLKGSLLLDTPAGLAKGGDTGPSIVPGKPLESLLWKSLGHAGDIKMPPKGKLPDAVIADFERWIKIGAPAPVIQQTPANVQETDWKKAREFWAFRTPTKSPPPNVTDAGWPLREIDRFVLGGLEKHGLKPVGPAGKRELIRRASFDLTGLPPTPEEVDTFVADSSPDANARLVDRLLASPAHGERWARYWLDISRYADDKALAFVTPRPHAWRYRDWVVKALNDDMPYDRFLMLQLAGDLLNEPQTDPFVRLAGLGFQGLGAEYHRGSVAAQVMADELDDRIDTVTRGLLGLTVACARCHDHKYDPIPTRDYYSLAAAYNGSELAEKPLVTPAAFEQYKTWEKQTKEADARVALWLKDQARELGKPALLEADKYLLTAWQYRVRAKAGPKPNLNDLAKAENLQPTHLARAVQWLETTKPAGQEAPIAAWLSAAEKAFAVAAKDPAKATATEELKKAAGDLKKAIQDALPKAGEKNPPALLKAIWLAPNSLFFLSEKEAEPLLAEPAKQELAKQRGEIDRLRKNAPPAPPMAHAIQGGGVALRINIRGNVDRLGEPAPPGFLRVISDTKADPGKPAKFTRLELAEAIASKNNPLTARVIVNRVWHYHFGKGLVGTPGNFGALGDRPTHPELLDSLAVRFMENGWSLKWLHREMMLSRTYQLASTASPANIEKDVENHYLWRHTPGRLDFESWRDSLLDVSGRLNRTTGGPSIELTQADNARRTLYAKISRLQLNPLLALFDFPDANVTSDRRNVTTVPQQQLFALNSEFMTETARAFAKRLETSAPAEADRIRLAFRLAYGRSPTSEEETATRAFLGEPRPAPTTDKLTPWEQFAQAILSSNEFQWID